MDDFLTRLRLKYYGLGTCTEIIYIYTAIQNNSLYQFIFHQKKQRFDLFFKLEKQNFRMAPTIAPVHEPSSSTLVQDEAAVAVANIIIDQQRSMSPIQPSCNNAMQLSTNSDATFSIAVENNNEVYV